MDCEWAEANTDKIEDKAAAAKRLEFQLGWYFSLSFLFRMSLLCYLVFKIFITQLFTLMHTYSNFLFAGAWEFSRIQVRVRTGVCFTQAREVKIRSYQIIVQPLHFLVH